MLRALTFLALLLVAAVAQSSDASAQATRTWVSGVGDDANPCSRTAPCKTFAGAISKTATGGEISVLDPGGFGTVTITKSISISADGDLGGILAAGTNGITVSSAIPAGARVYLHGLHIEGAATGLNGIRVLGPAQVFVEDTVIRDFTQNGVDIQGPAGARVYLNRVTLLQTNNAVNILGTGGAGNSAFLKDVVVDKSANAGINVGTGGSAVVAGSSFSGSGVTDFAIVAGASVISLGNNVIRNGTPTSTSPLK